jgi:hypothetical protein
MCDQHLLGEHSEMHQEVGTFKRHPHGLAVVRGHVEKLQVFPESLRERHDALAAEMLRRGINHESPLEDFKPVEWPAVPHHHEDRVREENRRDIKQRCDACAARMAEMAAHDAD